MQRDSANRHKKDDLIEPMRTFSTKLHTESKKCSWNSRYPKAYSPPATIRSLCNGLEKIIQERPSGSHCTMSQRTSYHPTISLTGAPIKSAAISPRHVAI